MSEEKKVAKKPAAAPAAGTPAAASYTPKKKKQDWTMARCKKFARRYETTAEWKTGSPSSFKAATAHGWIKECSALFRKNTPITKTKKSA